MDNPYFQLLPWAIYSSFIGAGIVLLLPKEQKQLIRWVALLTSLVGVVLSLGAFFAYNNLLDEPGALGNSVGSKFVELVNVSWIPQLNIRYFLAVDGINLPLVLLTGIVAVTGILFSWNIEMRTKEFFAFFLVLIGGVYGVFMAMDVFLLFVFYELAIIPKYFIIAIWGSTRKEYAAMKLVLYSFIGSALVFVGMLAIYYVAGAVSGGTVQTFDILALHRSVKLPVDFQFWCFPVIFVGFAILAGMWPFHTWAPTGHVAAPTAASMLLAGVVMKLGAYGCLRIGMLLMPEGARAWVAPLAVIAVINILYGAAVALVQKDFKFIIGYSSVSHMGFVLLGLVTLNSIGMSGAVLQMFSHGIVASLLFAVVGRMVYERTHTRQLDELGGLAKVMPFVFFTFVIGGLTSMGMPGFSGFWAEAQVLGGTLNIGWTSDQSAWPQWLLKMALWPVLVVAAGAGILITVAYIWNAVNKVFLGGDEDAPHAAHASDDSHGVETTAITHGTTPNGHGAHGDAHGAGRWADLPPITWPEKIAAVILMALMVIVGLYPRIMLDMIGDSVKPLVELLGQVAK